MTYGWAILIISLALGVLYSLGVLNPKNFTPRVPPGSCFVFRPNGPGTTDILSLQGTCGYLPMYVAQFNGIDGSVKVALTPLLKVTSLTAEIWLYPYAYNDQVSGGGSHHLYPEGDGFGITTYPDSWIMWVYNGSGRQYIYVYYGNNKVLNQWNHVVLTYDMPSGSMKAYWNGVLVGTRNLPAGSAIVWGGGPLDIGGPGSYHTYGIIANVQIYNTALSQQEIQYLYQEGLGGGPIRLASLVAWWPLNGDAKDYSGNNNHGTIYGGLSFIQNYNPP
jgi:hypothetical protein